MMNSSTNISIFEAGFKERAYETYHNLRDTSPAHPIQLPSGRAWLITRYEDVLAILKDNQRFIKNPRTFMTPEEVEKMYLPPELMNHMLNTDQPDHTRLRNLVQKAFTPRMIAGLRDEIVRITERLLNEAEQKGTIDLIRDFSYPLPIVLICEMLGIPEKDHHQFREWSSAIVSILHKPENMKGAGPAITNFIAYLKNLITERRTNLGEDLISSLIQAEEEGSKLCEQELYSMIFLLILAGHDTTVNLIGNGMVALLEHPDQFIQLRENPALIEGAVEEMLRFSGPVEMATNRWAAEEIHLHGQIIQKKDLVLVVLASANRDPEVFENPDQFDITRTHNRHVAFGTGSHFCLGAPLARLEAHIAINTLLRRFPKMQLAVPREQLRWRTGLLGRGFEEIPLCLTKKVELVSNS